MTFDKQRLHKKTLIAKPLNRFLSFIGPLIVILLFNFPDLTDITSFETFLDEFLSYAVIVIPIIILVIVGELVQFFRTYYWVDGNRIVLESGLFVRKQQDIQINRIQSIDTSEPVIHRLLHLTKVIIKTPGKGITLDAMSQAQYEELSHYLNDLKHHLKQETAADEMSNEDVFYSETISANHTFSSDPSDKLVTEPAADEEAETLYHLSVLDIIKMTLMSGSFFSGVAVLLVGLEFLTDALPIDALFSNAESFVLSTSILLLIMVFVVIVVSVYLLAIAATVIKNYNYTVKRTGDFLIIKKGLFETKSQTVNLKNIQSLEEEQNWIHSILGFTSFFVSITSDSKTDNKNAESEDFGKINLFPLIKKQAIIPILTDCLPNYQFSPAVPKAPKRSYRRFIQIPILFWGLVAAAVSYWLWSWVWVAWLPILLLYLIYGYRAIKLTGFALNQEEVTIQTATLFGVTQSYIRKERILSMKVKQTPFLKRVRLCKLSFSAAMGNASQTYQLDFIEESDGFILFNWFKKEGGSADENN